MHVIIVLAIILCVKVKVNTGINVFCQHPMECDSPIIADYVLSRGYKSIVTDVYSKNIECDGSLSCGFASIMEISWLAECQGSNSCININSFGLSGNGARCDGASSCAYTTFMALDSANPPYIVSCAGHMSCAYASFYDIPIIYAYGGNSLKGAKIYTTQSLTVVFLGHLSGLNTTIITRAGDECNINCYASSCIGLIIEGDGNCTFNNWTQQILRRNGTDYDIMNNASILTTLNDQKCTINSTYAFDIYQERMDGVAMLSNGNAICCRGMESCMSLNITSDEIIICSGYRSCRAANIQSNADISCFGEDSCRSSVINTMNNIYCMGSGSCMFAHIQSGGSIICSGSISCEEATIRSNGSITIVFYGREAGRGSTIHCSEGDVCHIICAGYESCGENFEIGVWIGFDRPLAIICDGICIVECDAGAGCPDTLTPTATPTDSPTTIPTAFPTVVPTYKQTLNPTWFPSNIPSIHAITMEPTIDPSYTPTELPTIKPTIEPSSFLSFVPSKQPSVISTTEPTHLPTAYPIQFPTLDHIPPPAITTTKASKPPTVVTTINQTGIGSNTLDADSSDTTQEKSKKNLIIGVVFGIVGSVLICGCAGIIIKHKQTICHRCERGYQRIDGRYRYCGCCGCHNRVM